MVNNRREHDGSPAQWYVKLVLELVDNKRDKDVCVGRSVWDILSREVKVTVRSSSKEVRKPVSKI